jgi:hypothetical protein
LGRESSDRDEFWEGRPVEVELSKGWLVEVEFTGMKN